MRQSKYVVFALLAGVVMLAGARPICAETTWYVDDDAPADFATIQAAIDASSDGDTIIVRDGTYTGAGNRDIDFGGRAIHLRSENGPENCVIDAQGGPEPHRGFIFQAGEDESSILDGFTITAGYVPNGGGISCSGGASPTITNNIITHNTATDGGGGISCSGGASPTITNNIITHNTATDRGGGIGSSHAGSPIIVGNVIAHNKASVAGYHVGNGGGIYCDGATDIRGNVIASNTAAYYGGGVFTLVGRTAIANNRIVDNDAGQGGGGIMCWEGGWPTIVNTVIADNSAVFYGGAINVRRGGWPTITNSILWSNDAGSSAEIWLAGMSSLTVSFSNIAGGEEHAEVEASSTLHWGPGNIDTDPLFADPDNGDYHLKSEHGRWDPNANGGNGGWVADSVTSPCIDAGNAASGFANEPQPNGGRVNMGAYGNTNEASRSAGYVLAVTTSGSGAGTLELSPPGGAYEPGTTVTLTAVASPGRFFDHWEGDLTGSANPATIVMDSNKSVVAHFIYPQLTVLSAPIVDVGITGTRAGSTPYTADCDLHEMVALTAPESVSVGGKTYYFELWFVDNVSVLPSEGRPFNEVEVTMDDGHTVLAQYGWRLPGDYNDDCTVNILDLLFVRNRLQTKCSE